MAFQNSRNHVTSFLFFFERYVTLCYNSDVSFFEKEGRIDPKCGRSINEGSNILLKVKQNCVSLCLLLFVVHSSDTTKTRSFKHKLQVKWAEEL